MAMRVPFIANHVTPGGAPQLNPFLQSFLNKASPVLIGKDLQLRLAWCCVAAGGHLLIEDAPGMGKTTMVKLIAKLCDLPWKRIQCTSDMLPADVTGGNIFDDGKRAFVFVRGPLFTNLVMADELNRASSKSQSAFLQAMEENSVTIDGETHQLARPFVIIATQNPLDSAGTNALPESQLDRFMMSISLGLPGRDSEKRLLMEPPRKDVIDGLTPVLSRDELLALQDAVAGVHAGDRVAEYILDLVSWIRERAHGLSPRTVLALTSCSRAWAYGVGRDFITPADVKAVAKSVLCHRLILLGSSGCQNSDDLVEAALNAVHCDG